jgi:hypothetical protein
MMVSKHNGKAALIGILTLACAGCGGSGLTPPVIGEPSDPPAPPPPQSATAQPDGPSPLKKLFLPKDVVVGTPTEVYTRVARGVLTCWFGADGPLKSKYLYRAQADPVSRGGNSEIKIMTRDADAEDPSALRAYRIGIAPSQEHTRVEIENVRIPEDLALRLKVDVERWSAADDGGCGADPVTAGWNAEPVAAAKPGTKEKKKKPKN